MISTSIKSLLSISAAITGAITLLSITALASIPEGLWLSACRDGLEKVQLISQGNQSRMSEKFHQDRLCKQVSFEFVTYGNLNFPSENSNQIDFSYSQIQLVIHVEEVIHDFNEREVCGLTNWKRSTPQTITGMKCALFNIHKPTPIPQAGEMKYGIYKIENDQLYFGKLSKDLDSSSSEKRPQEYELKGYEKQNLLNALGNTLN